MSKPVLTRRDFLRGAGLACACMATPRVAGALAMEGPVQEARFYDKLARKSVRCGLCPWRCEVKDGARGRCGVRENMGGTFYSLVYGRPVAANNDPIEKKPFFHVYPGSRSFSIATAGCNFDCQFCQNWEISQRRPEEVPVPYASPEQIAVAATGHKCRTVAYTYTEPTIFAEYVIDCARAAKEKGLGNVVVSNGFINEAPLKEYCEIITAMKVDFKAYSEKFYEEVCMGQMKPVLDTLKRLAGSGVWFELVVLTIPTLNDNMDDIKAMAAWVVKELGTDVPVHFTRFHPDYNLRNLPPTPYETLYEARRISMTEGCNFVYTGNMPGGEGENTYCPGCKAVVVDRYGHLAEASGLEGGKCRKCGRSIPGVW